MHPTLLKVFPHVKCIFIIGVVALVDVVYSAVAHVHLLQKVQKTREEKEKIKPAVKQLAKNSSKALLVSETPAVQSKCRAVRDAHVQPRERSVEHGLHCGI